MSGRALILTQQRLKDAHYLALAVAEARDARKPPVTIHHFWKNYSTYDDPATYLDETCQWIEKLATPDDFVVLQGEEAAVQHLRTFCKEQQLNAFYPLWDPEPLLLPFDEIAEDT